MRHARCAARVFTLAHSPLRVKWVRRVAVAWNAAANRRGRRVFWFGGGLTRSRSSANGRGIYSGLALGVAVSAKSRSSGSTNRGNVKRASSAWCWRHQCLSARSASSMKGHIGRCHDGVRSLFYEAYQLVIMDVAKTRLGGRAGMVANARNACGSVAFF